MGGVRGSVVSLLAVACAVSLTSSGCLENPAVTCKGGYVCSPGTVCDEAHHGCATPAQLATCTDKLDAAACSYPGVSEGACYEGVCLPGGCGNGILDDMEVCDDRNRLHGDGCSADCRSTEICGNNIVDAVTGEGCDDGNTNDGDGCQGKCQTVRCGDGIQDKSYNEACDEGAANSDAPNTKCRTNCQLARCGDGIVDDAKGEACDDGNILPGDGCSGLCQVEVCGNGVLDVVQDGAGFVPKEECDDGEIGLEHDGCDATCRREEPIWRGPPATLPSPRWFDAMVFDASRAKMVLFGGEAGPFSNETWEYDSDEQVWTQIDVPGHVPTPRSSHAMVYDGARKKVVLFGGYDGLADGETWEYDGTVQRWTRVALASASAPSPRGFHAMAYDAAHQKVVLFGGSDAETWEYDGATETWSKMSPATSPSARSDHAMTYDPRRGKIVLFGGTVSGNYDAETWEYEGQSHTWTQQSPTGAPTGRSHHGLAYDAARDKVLMFGGQFAGAYTAETWEYDGTAQTWSLAAPSGGAPAGRMGHAMAFDTARGQLVVFGGRLNAFDGPLDNGTWEYIGSTRAWTQVGTGAVAPSPRIGHAIAYDAARGEVLLFGGRDSAVLNDTWTHDIHGWTKLTSTGSTPSVRHGHAMAFDTTRGRVVMFGGTALIGGGCDGCATGNAETWEYVSQTQTWSQITIAAASPSARSGHAIVYDAARGKVVLFGGFDGTLDGETWEYDGQTQTWTQVVISGSAPSARQLHAMAYDASRRRTVLFGGDVNNGRDGETWEYDGATQTWKQVAVGAASPSPRRGHALAYDAARRRIVLVGGSDGVFRPGDIWEYDGVSQAWSELTHFASAPSARDGTALAYDAVNARVLLFGGDDGAPDGETWSLQFIDTSISDACTTGFDGDGDVLVGCRDPDCWGRCHPDCPPHSTAQWPAGCTNTTHACGDGICNSRLETARLCPLDCGPPGAVCGDFLCDAPENTASCPGDCH